MRDVSTKSFSFALCSTLYTNRGKARGKIDQVHNMKLVAYKWIKSMLIVLVYGTMMYFTSINLVHIVKF